ncbi:alpha/beta fold hydrolase [Rhodococcus qingshengii]|jgi:pimeloyl-ACP methyl ester carboxylesterase|uniref:Alpha/beta hydrolase n=3 Tax=Rhodococcus TaxID=1827 RepID=C1BDX5_RHOOB|nr:hypothetical protein [Rhodococcus qingshengii]EKT83430.1 hypothetical protein WSS_A07219 [Rhodococcus opacus M213]ELB93922.1 hypothetical protein Rwratislav_06560 [Rhodococcus wratislaviensis IFP 2016]BAH47178.1 hypothetical protein ROP_pROB02-01710 [Rhodococcus opacus B4]BAQ00549.1 hypothetical protein [Rhodococcus sp. 065240]QXC46738.1 hypothetical protein KSE96_32230 [Rhodococcus qingshengii]
MTVTTIGSSSHTIDVDGITTHYHKAGPGDPVLLLHGPWTGGVSLGELAAHDPATRRQPSRFGP